MWKGLEVWMKWWGGLGAEVQTKARKQDKRVPHKQVGRPQAKVCCLQFTLDNLLTETCMIYSYQLNKRLLKEKLHHHPAMSIIGWNSLYWSHISCYVSIIEPAINVAHSTQAARREPDDKGMEIRRYTAKAVQYDSCTSEYQKTCLGINKYELKIWVTLS